MSWPDVADDRVRVLLDHYVAVLDLPRYQLWATDDRAAFSARLGRRVPSAYGGAYVYLSRLGIHAVLINLDRIDLTAPRALEIVVCEELVHMRDHLDGDRRRHAKHGHDRVAHRVAALTGASLEEIRSCLIPVERRPARYLYGCPRCGKTVRRRVRGTWGCGSCSPVFRKDLVLQLISEDGAS
ncbi:MAG TPA: hypothetical protein VGT61_04800 [Thermomicrobiales bacterium]|nr:hypothetical protein [Thermomicrobiales bacterium]